MASISSRKVLGKKFLTYNAQNRGTKAPKARKQVSGKRFLAHSVQNRGTGAPEGSKQVLGRRKVAHSAQNRGTGAQREANRFSVEEKWLTVPRTGAPGPQGQGNWL